MKHIKSYENIIEEDELPNNIKLAEVMWNTFYRTFNYDTNNRELGQLSVGDYTNKGLITKKREHNGTSFFTTEEGEFRANQFKVYTSNNYWELQEFIEIKLAQNKFNL